MGNPPCASRSAPKPNERLWYRLHNFTGWVIVTHVPVYAVFVLLAVLGCMSWWWLTWPVLGLSLSLAVKMTLDDPIRRKEPRAVRLWLGGTISATILTVIADCANNMAAPGKTFADIVIAAFVDVWAFGTVYAIFFAMLTLFELCLPSIPPDEGQ